MESLYYLQFNVTLYNPAVGFFGRTYKGKESRLKVNIQDKILISDSSEWVLFYTQIESIETKAVVEGVLLEVD